MPHLAAQTFTDEENDIYILRQRSETYPFLILEEQGLNRRVYLYRSLLKKMLPYIKNFVETGKLYDL